MCRVLPKHHPASHDPMRLSEMQSGILGGIIIWQSEGTDNKDSDLSCISLISPINVHPPDLAHSTLYIEYHQSCLSRVPKIQQGQSGVDLGGTVDSNDTDMVTLRSDPINFNYIQVTGCQKVHTVIVSHSPCLILFSIPPHPQFHTSSKTQGCPLFTERMRSLARVRCNGFPDALRLDFRKTPMWEGGKFPLVDINIDSDDQILTQYIQC